MNNRDAKLQEKIDTQQQVKSELSQMAAQQFAEVTAKVNGKKAS